MKKCSSMSPHVVLLDFVIYSKGVEADPDKVHAIQEWQFLLLCMEFVAFMAWPLSIGTSLKKFSTIMAPITNCMRKGQFVWTKEALQVFEEIKRRWLKLLFYVFQTSQRSLK